MKELIKTIQKWRNLNEQESMQKVVRTEEKTDDEEINWYYEMLY